MTQDGLSQVGTVQFLAYGTIPVFRNRPPYGPADKMILAASKPSCGGFRGFF